MRIAGLKKLKTMRIVRPKNLKLTSKQKRERAIRRREDKIDHILRLVREIGEYARENLCVEDAQMEELEMELRECIK